ncbi:MAG: PAS domain-containing protein [Nodosilinea sp.]
MSTGTILCVSEQPARRSALGNQLAEAFVDYSLVLVAATELAAIAYLSDLVRQGAEVTLVIVDQALAAAPWMQTLYRHFPRALALVLSPDLAAPLETAIPPAQIYRRLALPWAKADLLFTVGEGLRRYRQEQQLAQLQAAIAQGPVAEPAEPCCPDLREAQLRQSEEVLKLTLDLTDIGAWSWCPDTGEYDWNPKMTELLELPLGLNNIFQRWCDRIHPDDHHRVDATIGAALATGVPFVAEYRYRMDNGTVVWRWLKGQGVYTETGSLERAVGITQDITPGKHIELALAQAKERYRRATQAARAGVWELNIATQTGYLDSTIKAMVGYTEAETDHSLEQWLGLIHPDDRTALSAAIQGFSNSAQADGAQADFVVEYRMVHRDGSVLWVLSRGQLQRDPQGYPELFFGTTTDITQRKQMELALKQLNAELEQRVKDRTQALQESRSMMQLVLDTIPLRVFWKDRNSCYLGCNLAFARDLGLKPDQVIGKTDAELPFVVEAARYRAEDAQIVSAQVPRLSYEELLSVPRDGEIYARTSKVPLTNADGAVMGVLGCYEDISDIKQVEASLRQLNTELEQRVHDRTCELQQAVEISEAASRAKGTFLANMSHELRTPLNAILGFSQLLACDETLSYDSREAIDIINRSGEHLLGLINDILDMTKIEAGQVSLQVVSFDLDDLLASLVDMFDFRARNKGLCLVITRHPSLPRHLRADEPKLRQVLINLVGNAIKFTHQGQVAVQVVPTDPVTQPLGPDDTLALTFRVSDTGIGIALADQAQLFEPFMQVSQGADGLGGTGLGLTISRQFVAMLGGDITVESQLGQGAQFSFTLPVQVAGCPAKTATPLTARVTGLAPGQARHRILVVDDDKTHRYLLTQLLQSVGFEVRDAENGQQAIDLWQHWRPQLIWLDMRMPVLSGYEAAQYIRAQESASAQGGRLPPTKIIALTANAFEDDRAQAIDIGCDDFVRKPFQLNHLLTKLVEHLQVQYTYGPEAVAPTTPLAEIDAITALRRLPVPQLIGLHQATLQLDSERMTRLIAALPPDQAPLAALLTRQLTDYAFDALHTLFQQAQQG